jgi:hypothetical protein
MPEQQHLGAGIAGGRSGELADRVAHRRVAEAEELGGELAAGVLGQQARAALQAGRDEHRATLQRGLASLH